MKKRLLLLFALFALAFITGCGAKSEPDPVIKLNPKIDYTSINPDTDLLLVKDSNGKYGFIDTKGNIAIPLQFELAMPFSEGLACIATKQYHGYIDKTGKLVLKNHYEAVLPFINGRAIFVTRDNDENRYGIIDKNGNIVVQPIYSYLHLESDGMTAFEDANSKWGYMDSDCKVVIAAQFIGADDFHNGLAAVQTDPDRQWAYIDRTGKLTGDLVSSDFSPDFQVFTGNRDISTQDLINAQLKLKLSARNKVNNYGYCGQGLYWGDSSMGIS